VQYKSFFCMVLHFLFTAYILRYVSASVKLDCIIALFLTDCHFG